MLVLRIQQMNNISRSTTNESQTITVAVGEQRETKVEVAHAFTELATLATKLQSLI